MSPLEDDGGALGILLQALQEQRLLIGELRQAHRDTLEALRAAEERHRQERESLMVRIMAPQPVAVVPRPMAAPTPIRAVDPRIQQEPEPQPGPTVRLPRDIAGSVLDMLVSSPMPSHE